jgi:hypothetical protein
VSALHVAGVGLWVGAAPPPPATLLPPALRRRAGVLCRAVAEAVARAAAEGGADLSRTPIVYGSVYGETTAAVEMMGAFETGEGLPSPTTFHNSVHNAPAGYLSIATGCHAFSSSIAAGPETVAMALLDAFLLLAQRGGDAIVALADEPVPEPLGRPDAYPVAAAAFLLRVPSAAPARARMGPPRIGGGAWPEVAGELVPHPCAPAFRLAAAVASGLRGPLSLGEGPQGGWAVDLEPVP